MNPRAINPWKPGPSMTNRLEQAMFDARLPQAGRMYVDACITVGPSRQVQGRSGNNTFTYYSHKTQATLKLESRRGEQAMAVLLDHDPKVIAFFAQPPQVSLDIEREDGSRATTKPYTPDFLVVYEGRVVVVETKDTVALLEKAHKNPHQFYRDLDGAWHHRAAEKYFNGLGIEFQLKATSDLPAALVGNLRFLEDYMNDSSPSLAQSDIDAIRESVLERGFVPIHELLANRIPSDHVYRAIVEQHVYFDLEHDNLQAVDSVALYANKATREAMRLVEVGDIDPSPPIPGTLHLRSGAKIEIFGREYTVILEGERDVRLLDRYGKEEVKTLAEIDALKRRGEVSGDALRNEGDAHQLADFSAEEIEKAREKLEAARAGRSDRFSDRSVNRFKQVIAGVQSYIDQLICLIDRNRDKGNRESRISAVNLNLIERAIETGYNTPKQQTMKGAYAKYLGLCAGAADPDTGVCADLPREESGAPIKPVSYQTFCKYCNDLYDVKKREGRRSAYQKKAIVTSLDNCYPTHGVRAHEVCEMDHTVANISLQSPNKVALGKPTLSVIVDSHTCHTRALVLSYEPPSSRTVLRLLRDYVRRNHRLPRVLVVDNGKEFHSHELEYFCRLFGIELRFRSPGMPRGAAMVERALGAIEEEVFSELDGNTRIMKDNTRQVTKSVDPFRQTSWTLVAAYKAVDQYLFQVRHTRAHPALGMSPNEFEAKSKDATGQREFRMVSLDENVMLLTCPHAKRPKRKLDRRRGVNVNGIYYRHAAFDRVRHGTSVEVRVEPYNASVVYVNLGDRWVAATGNSSRWLCQRTHYEIEFALREEQRIMKLNAKRDGVSHTALAYKQRALRPEDFDERVALQQAEQCELDALLGITSAIKDIPTAIQAKAADNEKRTLPLPVPQQPALLPEVKSELPAPIPADIKPAPPANEDEFRFAKRFNLR